jgi:hypothetical protein
VTDRASRGYLLRGLAPRETAARRDRMKMYLTMCLSDSNRGASVITTLRFTPVAIRRRRETVVVVRTTGLREAGHLG